MKKNILFLLLSLAFTIPTASLAMEGGQEERRAYLENRLNEIEKTKKIALLEQTNEITALFAVDFQKVTEQDIESITNKYQTMVKQLDEERKLLEQELKAIEQKQESEM